MEPPEKKLPSCFTLGGQSWLTLKREASIGLFSRQRIGRGYPVLVICKIRVVGRHRFRDGTILERKEQVDYRNPVYNDFCLSLAHLEKAKRTFDKIVKKLKPQPKDDTINL